MLILIILFLLIVPLFNYWVFNNKKINSIIFISLFFVVFNILNVLLIGILDQKINVVRPLYLGICVSIILVFIILLVIKMIKNKEAILNWMTFKNAFYRYLPFLIASVIFIIIILFVNNFFPDTQAYLSVSKDFQNSLMMSFGNENAIETYYKVMPQIAVYGSLFFEMLPLGYYLLNPLLLFVIYTSILNEWILRKQIDIKINFQYLFVCLLMICLGVLTPFVSSFMTSGNIFNQSVILLIMFSVIFYNKENSYLCLLPLAILQFWSPTGYINGFLVGICIFIFSLIYSPKFKNIYFNLWFLSDLVLLPVFLVMLNKTFLILIFAFFVIWNLAFTICYFVFKQKINVIKNKLNILITYDWYQYSSYGLLLLVAILVPIIFYVSYNKKNLYTNQLAFLTMALYLIIFVYCLVKKIKFKQDTNYHLLFCLTSLISFLFIGVSILTKKDNESTWRIIYLNFGMGGIIDIILLVYLILTYCLFKIKFKPVKWTKWSIINNLIFSFLFVSSTIGFGLYNANTNSVPLFNVTNDVKYNLYKINNHDYESLMKFDDSKYQMLVDTQVYYLLNKANIVSSKFFEKFNINNIENHSVSNWTISAYGIAGTINVYNSQFNKADKIFERINEMILSQVINTLVLDNHSSYYQYLIKNLDSSKFKQQYFGDHLTILSTI